jgi:plasmid stabilization system protein ParE
MTYKIIISPQVDMELEEIAIFIAKDNPTRAISFINEMLDSILSRLKNFPHI